MPPALRAAAPRRDFRITYFVIKLRVTSQPALGASNFRGALISRLGQIYDRMLGCVSPFLRRRPSAVPVNIRQRKSAHQSSLRRREVEVSSKLSTSMCARARVRVCICVCMYVQRELPISLYHWLAVLQTFPTPTERPLMNKTTDVYFFLAYRTTSTHFIFFSTQSDYRHYQIFKWLRGDRTNRRF